MLATFIISNNHSVCGTPAAHAGAHLLSQRRTGLLYIPILGALSRGQRGQMVVGTGGGVQWVVPGRDIMHRGQDACCQPIMGGDGARIHACREANNYHWTSAAP